MVGDYYYGTGRRKSAVARVFLKQGKGELGAHVHRIFPKFV